MRVTRIELDGIGPFEDVVLEFPEPSGPGEVVLFEGPNGSGKTTIAQFLTVSVGSPHLFGAGRSGLGPPQGELDRRFTSPAGHAHAVIQENGSSVRLGLTRTGVDRYDIERAAQPLPPPVTRLVELHRAALEDEPTSWAAFAFRGHASSAILEASGPQPIHVAALAGALSFAGSGAASGLLGQFLTNIEFDRVQAKVYATEKQGDPESGRFLAVATSRKHAQERLQHALSRVLDRKIEIHFPLGQRAPRVLFDSEEIPIDLLGEGMRNTFSWLSDLLVRLERTPWAEPERSPFDQNFWLILDEIEESLHPTMQARVLPAIRELFPNARIYATTHSPFVVASLGEGHVFSLRPDPKSRRVRGHIHPTPIEHGRSLEWVVDEIFSAPSGFVDQETRDRLATHLAGVNALRRGADVGWDGFLEARAWLLALNEEVRAVVASREVPVRGAIAAKVQERSA
ncbi:MAG TPA: AAA family ATPase [Candidatus Nanopelagicales bacterium]|nr:AAA family ATPase [Candidatus Nanopelagicales bacterium]